VIGEIVGIFKNSEEDSWCTECLGTKLYPYFPFMKMIRIRSRLLKFGDVYSTF